MDRDPLYGTRQLYAAILQTIIDDATGDPATRKELRKWLKSHDYIEVLLEWCLWANIHPNEYIKAVKKSLGMCDRKR